MEFYNTQGLLYVKDEVYTFPQTRIKLRKKKKSEVVSLLYSQHKTMMSSFQNCWVPTTPSAQGMKKLQVFLLRKRVFSVVCFESQLGTAQKYCRPSRVILALPFHNSIKLWQAGDLYQSFQHRSLGAESAFCLCGED